MKLISKTMMIILALTCLQAIAAEVKVIGKNPRKEYFPANGTIRLLDAKGTISFVNSRDGQTYTFRRNQIFSFETDMPRDVLALENIFRSLDYEKVVALTPRVSAQSMWTGWGSYVSFLKAMAEMSLKKFDDAVGTLKSGDALFADADGCENLMKYGVSVVAYAKSGGNVIEKPSAANMLLNGLALEKKNDLRTAALEYMKAMELYPEADSKGVPSLDRLVAMARLVEVLKAQRDMSTANRIATQLASGK